LFRSATNQSVLRVIFLAVGDPPPPVGGGVVTKAPHPPPCGLCPSHLASDRLAGLLFSTWLDTAWPQTQRTSQPLEGLKLALRKGSLWVPGDPPPSTPNTFPRKEPSSVTHVFPRRYYETDLFLFCFILDSFIFIIFILFYFVHFLFKKISSYRTQYKMHH